MREKLESRNGFFSTVTENITRIVAQDLPPHVHQSEDCLCENLELQNDN